MLVQGLVQSFSRGRDIVRVGSLLTFPPSELLIKSLGLTSGLALELNRATESEESAMEWSGTGRHGSLHDNLSICVTFVETCL